MKTEEIKLKLMNILLLANESQFSIGLNWYEKAREHAKYLANSNNITMAQACGVISALSPNNKWDRNLLDAEAFIKTPSIDTKVCTYKANRVKALRILTDSETPISEILGGRKTRSFFDNILNPNSGIVTVDLWMYRAAELTKTNKNYTLISDAISSIANEFGYKPYQIQAILWGVIRDASTKNSMQNDKSDVFEIAI